MADIQSATAENRRGKKRQKKGQDKNIVSASATHGGHENLICYLGSAKNCFYWSKQYTTHISRLMLHRWQVFLFNFTRPISIDTFCCTATVSMHAKHNINRMCADAQHDGCLARYRWRPLQKFLNSIPSTTPQSLAHTHCQSAVQQHCQYRRAQDLNAKWILYLAKAPKMYI